MHIWRSLPEGQLLAVLRWMQSRRQTKRHPAESLTATDTTLRPVEPAEPAGR